MAKRKVNTSEIRAEADTLIQLQEDLNDRKFKKPDSSGGEGAVYEDLLQLYKTVKKTRKALSDLIGQTAKFLSDAADSFDNTDNGSASNIKSI